jgi:diguanylate cyclase (GGDEF)-like protein
MPDTPLFNRIGTKVLLRFFAAIIPLIGVIVYLNVYISRDAVDHACNLLSRAVFETAAEQDGLVSGLREMLRLVAGLKETRAPDIAALTATLVQIKQEKPFLANLFFCDDRGHIVASAAPGFVGLDASGRKYFKDAVRRGGFSFGQYVISRVTQQPLMHFSMPVYGAGHRLAGVLVAALDLGCYARLFDRLGVPRGGFLDLFDSDGQRLLRYPPEAGQALGRPMEAALHARLAAGRTATPFLTTGTGRDARILAFRTLRTESDDPEPYGTIVIGLPVTTAMATAHRRLYISTTVSIASVLAAIIVAVVLGRVVIVRRLRILADLVTAVEQDRLCPLPHDFGDDELGRLGRRFTTLSRDLYEKNQKLAETMSSLSREKARLEDVVGQLGQAQTELVRQANHDALTGLANRRAFNDRLGQELSRSRRYATPFSLVLCDIDDFKLVNDTFGHLAGDEVLRILAGRIRACLREADAAFRVGGEEFALILPATSGGQGLVVAERLRKAVAEAMAPLPDGDRVRLTISCGLADWLPELDAQKDLYKAADQALYQAKAQGKNRSARWTPQFTA